METTKLEMEFLDEANKKFTISINEPRIDITPEEVGQAMDAIVGYDVFAPGMKNLVDTVGARVVTTTVDTLVI